MKICADENMTDEIVTEFGRIPHGVALLASSICTD